METSIKIMNAFSFNMIPYENVNIAMRKLHLKEADSLLSMFDTVENCIGHEDTNSVVQSKLFFPIGKGNRCTVKLKLGESAIIAQYIGPRLEAGATKLPDNSKIDFIFIKVNP